MSFIRNRSSFRLAVVALGVWLCVSGAATQAHAAKALTALRVVVVDEAQKPVPRASVVISRLKSATNHKVKGDPLQIKTSMEGAAPLPPLEQGFYMVQVICSGYQTVGDMVELKEPEQEYTVVLKPPTNQFSVHTDK
jgi:hypothetical protein